MIELHTKSRTITCPNSSIGLNYFLLNLNYGFRLQQTKQRLNIHVKYVANQFDITTIPYHKLKSLESQHPKSNTLVLINYDQQKSIGEQEVWYERSYPYLNHAKRENRTKKKGDFIA